MPRLHMEPCGQSPPSPTIELVSNNGTREQKFLPQVAGPVSVPPWIQRLCNVVEIPQTGSYARWWLALASR